MSVLFGTPQLGQIADRLREGFSSGGAERVDTDAVQPLTPYLEFLGEFYRDTLVEYRSAGHDEFCLRPDLTLAIAREVATGARQPGRYFYDDLVFRGARRVHLTEGGQIAPIQRQVGIEVFGSGDAAEDDASLVLQTLAALKAAGVDEVRITLSDVALISDVIDGFEVHENWKSRLKETLSDTGAFEKIMASAQGQGTETLSPLSRALSGLSPDEARSAVEEIFATSGVKQIGSRSLDDIASRMVTKAAEQAQPLGAEDAGLLRAVLGVEGPVREALDKIAGLLDGRGSPAGLPALRALVKRLEDGGVASGTIHFDADLSRHLSYYDGFIFEVFDASGEVFLGGGGRYNTLVANLSNGERTCSAVGAMLRPDRIASLLQGS
ncbi:MAG: ATP phosphoribosyltransferase regulatory subunit [Pseudomonadota bacterium]